MKEEIFKDEMKAFNIEVDDIEPNEHIFGAIEKTIHKMKNEYLVNRVEVVLNNNLIETRDKLTNYRTILGCRVSYDDLPKDVSFIVRPDDKPSYEKLEEENKSLQSQLKEKEDNWNYIKKMLKEARNEEFNINGYCGTCTDVDIDFLLNKMEELENLFKGGKE